MNWLSPFAKLPLTDVASIQEVGFATTPETGFFTLKARLTAFVVAQTKQAWGTVAQRSICARKESDSAMRNALTLR
jgi:hypothetical protein